MESYSRYKYMHFSIAVLLDIVPVGTPVVVVPLFLRTVIKGCDECQEATMLCIFPHHTRNEHM